MGKTWKDLPKDVSGYKPFRKRKKPLSDKYIQSPEAKMLEEQEMTRKLYGDGGYCAED